MGASSYCLYLVELEPGSHALPRMYGLCATGAAVIFSRRNPKENITVHNIFKGAKMLKSNSGT